jgi:hypothetical protein
VSASGQRDGDTPPRRPPGAAGRDNARGRGVIGDGVLLSSPVALGGTFDGRGETVAKATVVRQYFHLTRQ